MVFVEPFSLHSQRWYATYRGVACTFVGGVLHSLDMSRVILIRVTYPNYARQLPQMCKLSQILYDSTIA